MTNARWRPFVLVLGMAVVAVGCGGGEGSGSGSTGQLTLQTLERVGLEASDLQPGYQPKPESGLKTAQECVQTLSQTRESAALAGQLQALGLQGCYVSTYAKELRKGGDTRSNSPGSFAFLFGDGAAASQALPAIRSFLANSFRPTGDFAGTPPRAEDLPVSGLGDEAPPGLKFTVTARGVLTMTFVTHVWRNGNVVAGFAGSDALGDMTDDTILDIAKTIDYGATREGAER